MRMNASSNSDRLDAALAEYLRRVDAGEKVEVDAYIARFPDIAEELLAYFRDQDSLAKAAESAQTVAFAHSKTPSRSRGLQICCPHCSNQVELLVDTPYDDISCNSCGSIFNLVDREELTRFASPLKTIGRFELISRLGVGGFGSVWKGRDKELDRVVAIKIPRKGQLSPGEIEQFFKEARSAAQLRHPNIVPVHEVGRDGDTIFIVCDLVRGVDLSDWLVAHEPDVRTSAKLCAKIARALHHAHEAKVIHRDLKPSNVMIDVAGEPHLMDFGLAKREVGEITMTVDGQILGTPAYMSPEQAAGRGHWTDRRTDVYSLGVVMYRMVTGDLPFRGSAQMQVYQRLSEEPIDPRTLNRRLPKDVATICLKCLERDPNRRYPTALSLAEEIERFLEGQPIHARPISKAARGARWVKRKPWLAATLALGSILAVGGPTAAIFINASRQAALDESDKYKRLVDQAGADQSRLAHELESERKQRRLLAGRANAWQLWPIAAELGPRRQFILDAYDRQFEPAAARLDSSDLPAWDVAVGRIALGSLAQAAGEADQARKQLLEAERLLRLEAAEHPDDVRILEALAVCGENLSILLSEKSPEKSQALLKQSSSIYERLASNEHDQPRYRVDLAEAEMRSAPGAGDEASSHLRRAASEMEQLHESWPQDPIELYQLVMHLVQDEAAGPPLSLPLPLPRD
jgi:serine/threonine protein kinase/ribosomal protein S27E